MRPGDITGHLRSGSDDRRPFQFNATYSDYQIKLDLFSLDSNVVETEAKYKYQCGHCHSMFNTMDDVQHHMMELHMDSGIKVTEITKTQMT